MATPDSEAEAVRRQLGRALASRSFARNERLSRFLRFVVERHLEGRNDELKESVIALEVFSQRGYDPKQDSLVRTEAGRLRARLAEYYIGEGGRDPVIIELPKGGYVPLFRGAEQAEPKRNTRFPRRWLMVALGCFAVTLAATGWWRLQREHAPISIAVLPLNNVSQDSANEYFADGLTAEIIRDLSIIEGLAVRSQTSSFAFKGKPRNLREVGKQLAVDYIVEGSVLPGGRRRRINIQLVRVRDDFALWSGSYEPEMTDVLATQDEISRGIVNSLRLKLGGGRRRYEVSPEAYDLYLRARALEIQRGLAGVNESVGLFEQVVAKDPTFAPGYAGLAAACVARSSEDQFDRAAELSTMRVAAEKAIQLDPLLAEAHDALGMVYARDAQWDQSEKSFGRALELDPGRSVSYSHFAMFLLLPLGRIAEAVHQTRTAEKSDPLSAEVHFIRAYVLISAGRFDEAAGQCDKLPAGHPYRCQCLGRVWLGQDRTGAAIQILATSDRPVDRGFLGHAYARAGRREEAEKMAASPPFTAFQQALVFAGLGDRDRTLQALDRMAPLGPFRMGRALTFPEFSLLHGDPRVKALRKKVGLPE